MRVSTVVLLVSTLTVPLLAQNPTRPAGWRIRPDRPDADTTQLQFVAMAPGWHITTGPSLILWHPDKSATGLYIVESEIFFFASRAATSKGMG